MASFDFDPKAGKALICWRYPRGRKGTLFKKTVKVGSAREADRRAALIDETIDDIERGKLTLPPDADAELVKAFILSGGKVTEKPQAPPKPARPTTLGEIVAYYQTTVIKDQATRYTEDIHLAHLERLIGADTPLGKIGLDLAQAYAERRQGETAKGKRNATSPTTVVKELKTLRIVWNWVADRPEAPTIPTAFPFKLEAVQFPTEAPKPPFRTWEEIERTIKRGGLTEAEVDSLWECLYLDTGRVKAALEHVRDHATAPFLFPMLTAAAYTGARRSELCRSQIDDWNLDDGVVQIRQKKKKGRREEFSYRTVDINSALLTVVRTWFDDHPGGQMAFPHPAGGPLRPDSATYYLNETLAGSAWKVIKGWHTFRHSFASNLARAGMDQRYIDAWMGHHTEIRLRYQHLFPEQRRRAIEALVG